jgi:hypothetical protein
MARQARVCSATSQWRVRSGRVGLALPAQSLNFQSKSLQPRGRLTQHAVLTVHVRYAHAGALFRGMRIALARQWLLFGVKGEVTACEGP